jgi:hypothetical protein
MTAVVKLPDELEVLWAVGIGQEGPGGPSQQPPDSDHRRDGEAEEIGENAPKRRPAETGRNLCLPPRADRQPFGNRNLLYSRSLPRCPGGEIRNVRVAGNPVEELLGREPILGRSFSAEEFQFLPVQGAIRPSSGVILTHEIWQSQFGSRPDVLDQVIRIDGDPRHIIGVMPPGFRLFRDDRPELFVPLQPRTDHLTDRRRAYLEIIGRLRPGVTLERAQARLAVMSASASEGTR